MSSSYRLAYRDPARRRGSAGAVDDGAVKPPLTSLVDVMTILLVFLLHTFSVDGQLVTPSTDLELPLSTSRQRATPALSVELTSGGILVDGRHLGGTAAGAGADSLLVGPLYEELQRITAATGTGGQPQPISIMCDRRLGFHVLKRVVHTCSIAGYGDFSLLVRNGER